jgi:hypothetical protein
MKGRFRVFLITIFSVAITFPVSASAMGSGGVEHTSLGSARASQSSSTGQKFSLDFVNVQVKASFLPQQAFDTAHLGAPEQSASIAAYQPLVSITVTTVPFGTSNQFLGGIKGSKVNFPKIFEAAVPRLNHSSVISGLKPLPGASSTVVAKYGSDPDHQGLNVAAATWGFTQGARVWIVQATLEAAHEHAAQLQKEFGSVQIALTNAGHMTSIGGSYGSDPGYIVPPPSLPNPTWWNGVCDAKRNGDHTVIGKWGSLVACGPNNDVLDQRRVLEWECVELVTRYLTLRYGLPTIAGNGDRIADNTAAYLSAHPSAAPQLELVRPGSQQIPQAGDVMSYEPNHTDLVIGTTIDQNGNGSYTTLNENWSDGVFGSAYQNFRISNWTPEYPGGFVVGWIHDTSNPLVTPKPVIEPEPDNHSGPQAVVQSDGVVDAFWRTPSGGLGHDAYVPGTGWISAPLPGKLDSGAVPHAVVQRSGVIDVFWRTPDDGLGHDFFSPSVGWQPQDLPGSLAASAQPYAVAQDNGTVDVFWRSPTGGLGHDFYSAISSGWQRGDLGVASTLAGDPRPVVQPNGIIDVFWRSSTNGLGHDYFLPTSVGWQKGDLGSTPLAGDPHPVVQANGTIDVFWRTPSNTLGHEFYNSTAGWERADLGGSHLASDPRPVVQPDGTIDVFWRTPADTLGHDFYNSIAGWQQGDLGGSPVAGEPFPVVQPGGTIDVFWRTRSKTLGHDFYNSASGWARGDLGGSAVACGPHAGAYDGVVDVFWGTPSGGLGHDFYNRGWNTGDLGGNVDCGS